VAYDWTENFRTAVRQEFFRDAAGACTGSGLGTDLWSTTATVQYKIWKGLVGRLEYRHDQSDENVYRVRYSRPDITSQGCSRAARAWTPSRSACTTRSSSRPPLGRAVAQAIGDLIVA
jgi:Putative beta-barrel porin-2, OmpL-like. bbp2